MIIEFKNNEIRNSALIYNAVLDQIKMLYEDSPELAGELAISAIELVLTGDMSTTNTMIKAMLAQSKRITEADKEKYDKTVETKRNKAIVDGKLDLVANLSKMGLTQAQIGERLGLSQQAVSRKMIIIRRDYPELLKKSFTTVQPSTTSSQPDTSSTNGTTVVQGSTSVVDGCKTSSFNCFDF